MNKAISRSQDHPFSFIFFRCDWIVPPLLKHEVLRSLYNSVEIYFVAAWRSLLRHPSLFCVVENHSFNGATSPNHLLFHSLGAASPDHLSHSFTWCEYSRKIYLGCRRSLLLNGSHFLSLLSVFPPLEISFPFSVWLLICFFRFNKVGMYSSIQSRGESPMNINRQLRMWLPKQ